MIRKYGIADLAGQAPGVLRFLVGSQIYFVGCVATRKSRLRRPRMERRRGSHDLKSHRT
jgi:hypothetical protein